MSFLSDLLFLVVGIAVATFLIKLFVSLRVASKGPVWQERGDEEPGATNTDRPDVGIRTEQISLDAHAAPEQKSAEQPSPEYALEKARAAGGAAR
jgi:hypothetical protein